MRYIVLLFLSFILFSCSIDYMVSDIENSFNEGHKHYEQERYDEAIHFFEQSVNKQHWSALTEKSYFYMGKSYVELAKSSDEGSTQKDEHLTSAIESFRKITTQSDYWVKGQYETGVAFYEQQGYDSSYVYHKKVYEEYPGNSRADNALLHLAHRLRKLEENDSAYMLYKRVQEEYPNTGSFSDAAYRIGLHFLYIAEDTSLDVIVNPTLLPIAIYNFQDIKSESSRYIEGQFLIGYIYYLLEEYDSSFHYHEKLFTHHPTHSKADNALLYMGHHYRKTDELDSALVIYERVIKNYSESGAYDNALYWAGDNYYDRNWNLDNNKEKAIDLLTRFCAITTPENDKHARAIKKLKKMGVSL